MTVVQKPVYRVHIGENVYLCRDVYVSAWSEEEAEEYILDLYNLGRIELNMDDYVDSALSESSVYEEVTDASHIIPEYDVGGMMPPEE